MKIAIFTDVFLEVPGGIPSSIKQETEELEKRGDTVYIFCPGTKAFGNKNVKLVPINRFFKPNGAPLAKRPKVLEKYILEKYPEIREFNLFHVHYEMGTSIAGIRLAKRLKIPVVQTMHGREDSAAETNLPKGLKFFGASFLNYLHQKSLKHEVKLKKGEEEFISSKTRAKMFEIMVAEANAADYVLTPSKHFKEKLEKAGVKKKIFVVPNRISKNLIKEKPKLKEFKQGEELRIVFSSRVSREKRLSTFLLALARLPKDKKYLLEVFGDGNELKKCKKIARRKNLNVRFYGNSPREKIFKALDRAHLSATVSYNFDTQGMTILEASERLTPSLITDPDLLEGLPKNGIFLTKTPDVEGIFESLREIFKNPSLVREKSENLEKFYREKKTRDLTFIEFCDKIGVSA